MAPDDRWRDDPVLHRVLAARPVIPEDELSPTGERAIAIAARVLAVAGPPGSSHPQPPTCGRRGATRGTTRLRNRRDGRR